MGIEDLVSRRRPEVEFVPPREFLSQADEWLGRDEFVQLDPGGADRHGAWECTWVRRRGPISSWVTLAALPRKSSRVDFEVSAGADNGAQFDRALVGRLDGAFPDVLATDRDVSRKLLHMLRDGAEYAMKLESGALKQIHAFGALEARLPTGGPKVRPIHDRILVKREEESEFAIGGIIIPDTAKEKPQRGTVIVAGTGRVTEHGKRTPLDVKPGDRILFGKYSGSEVKIDDDQYLILTEEDVLAILE